jgi:hypothetical protein
VGVGVVCAGGVVSVLVCDSGPIWAIGGIALALGGCY